MTQLAFILADGDPGMSAVSEEVRNRVLTFGAYALVIGAILVWAAFFRKPKGKRRRIYRHQPHTWQQTPEARSSRRREHGSGRRRRRSKPQNNPSLADTGGLPPRRPDDVPPKGV